MASLPYIQLYVADYLADTIHLTTEEHGAYMLLIFNYWQTGKSIPVNRLSSISKLSNDRWISVEQTLSEFFTLDENNNWYHERIEIDLSKVKSKSTQASKAGKASAAKRAASKAIDSKEDSNGRSISVELKSNHTDTDTDTDTEKSKDMPQNLKVSMPPDFELNETNKNWVNDSNLTPIEKHDLVKDFIDYWTLDESKKTAKGWQMTFRKNPIVKRKIVNSKHRGQTNDSYQQAPKTSLAERATAARIKYEQQIDAELLGADDSLIR